MADPFPVIGFAGLRGAGKDTAGSAFTVSGFVKISFAEPLKEMLSLLLRYRGVPEGEVSSFIEGGRKEAPTPYLCGQSPRHAMQTLGTEWGREAIAADLWVDTFVRRVEQIERSGKFPGVVVTDVRFQNEIDTIQQRLGGHVYRVIRPWQHAGGDTHISEIEGASLKVDGELVNNFKSPTGFRQYVGERLIYRS